MMHVAMSDAINSVQGRFTRYITTVAAMPSASAEAAAASAARNILTELFSNQKTIIEEAYTTSMKAIPDGESKTQGVLLGKQVGSGSRGRRHSRARHLPSDHESRSLGANDAADYRAVRPCQAVGAEER
jgi:hypothetical protein